MIIYEQPAPAVRAVNAGMAPSLIAPAVAALVPLSLLTLRAWGARRRFAALALALSLAVLGLYVFAPSDLLRPGVLRGLLVFAACGALCRPLLVRNGDWPGFVLAFCVASVCLPLIFLLNGFWSNLGRGWDGLRPLLALLLGAPLLLALPNALNREARRLQV
jgi:hypothetical protein